MSKQCCYFQRRVSQRWSTSKQREFDHFEKSKKIFLSFKKELTHLINNNCFWSWSIKKKGRYETCNIKINVAECMVHKIWVCICWWQNKLMYWIALLVHIYTLLKKQHIYFSLSIFSLFFPIIPYCFIDVIISCHSDSYCRFVGAEVGK